LGRQTLTAGPDGYFEYSTPPVIEYPTATIKITVLGGWGYKDSGYSTSCHRPGIKTVNFTMSK